MGVMQHVFFEHRFSFNLDFRGHAGWRTFRPCGTFWAEYPGAATCSHFRNNGFLFNRNAEYSVSEATITVFLTTRKGSAHRGRDRRSSRRWPDPWQNSCWHWVLIVGPEGFPSQFFCLSNDPSLLSNQHKWLHPTIGVETVTHSDGPPRCDRWWWYWWSWLQGNSCEIHNLWSKRDSV